MTSSSSSVPNSESKTFLGAASKVPWAPCLLDLLAMIQCRTWLCFDVWMDGKWKNGWWRELD